jgi:signal recognition particle receptor subunit beta
VGGQATKLWKHYFDHIDAVIFVVDSTDEEKLIFAREELRRLLQSATATSAASGSTGVSGGIPQPSDGLGDVPFLLMYNKKDLPTAKTHQELSGRLEVESFRE